MPRPLALAVLFLLAGCGGLPSGVQLGGGPLVSAQTPPGTGLVNDASEPQPINSLPPGVAGRPSNTPFATAPNFLSATFGR